MDRFFQKYQKELLEVANSWYGRQSLQIPSNEKVMRIARNSISLKLDKKTTQSIYYTADVYSWYILTGHRNNPQDKAILKYISKKNLHSDPYGDWDRIQNWEKYLINSKSYLYHATDTYNTSAGDGDCLGNLVEASTWATTRSQADAQSKSDAANLTYSSMDLTGGSWQLRRIFMPTDASANQIPAGDTITAASLNVYHTSDAHTVTNAPSLVLCKMQAASTSALVVGDYDTYDSLGSPVEWGPRILYSNFTQDANNVIAFSSAQFTQISRTGFTYNGLRSSGDIDNSAPTGQNVLSFKTSEAVANKPYLSVTHAVAGSSDDLIGFEEF